MACLLCLSTSSTSSARSRTRPSGPRARSAVSVFLRKRRAPAAVLLRGRSRRVVGPARRLGRVALRAANFCIL
eukprot:6567305-Lingulodinium_polyedra.AAC.1